MMRAIQSNPKLFVCEHMTYLTLTKRVNTYVVILSNEKLNSLRGPYILIQVLCQIFSLQQIPKTVKLSTGKVQLNAELTF